MTFKVWGVLLTLSAPVAALAQGGAPLPAPVIAIIDVDEVQLEALAAKAVRTQADKYRQEFQQTGQAEEAVLRTQKQSIEQQAKSNALSPDALAEKARAFDASVADYQRKEAARRRAFEKSYNIAMAKVQKAMIDATGKAATSHGANVVLPRGQVVLFDDKMNLTKEIVALMDKDLPTVDFPAPQIEGDAPPQPPAAQTPPKKKN
jgi:Skp family chaperone for outer membrane proteins